MTPYKNHTGVRHSLTADRAEHDKMLNPDLYLGSFLILSGLAMSLLNLRRIVIQGRAAFPSVLLSENILLTCIGVAFVVRGIHDLKPFDTTVVEMELRSADMVFGEKPMDCSFKSVLMSYGPLVVSMVNSFLSLIIDNYMHYRMIADVKRAEEESAVRSVDEDLRPHIRNRVKRFIEFWKRNFMFVAVVSQWIIPILIALSMYPINITERKFLKDDMRRFSESCIAAVDIQNENCSLTYNANYTFELRNHITGMNYFEVYENEPSNIDMTKLDAVVSNVYNIIGNLQNNSQSYTNSNGTSAQWLRKPKVYSKCMRVCYLDNKNLTMYMFSIAVVSYFVPITISTVILTKIHVMDLKKPNIKTYVNRELLYNILFWTPVVFDTFLSITICSYSMSGTRTSIFNIIANVYQAIKNFMNTKYFKDNAIIPV